MFGGLDVPDPRAGKILHEEIKQVIHPETEESQWPWMTSAGYPITENGAVEGCSCAECVKRES